MNIEDDDKVEEAVLKWLGNGNVPKEALNIEDDDEHDDDGESEPHPDFRVGKQGFYVTAVTVTLRRLKPADDSVADPGGSAAEDDDD